MKTSSQMTPLQQEAVSTLAVHRRGTTLKGNSGIFKPESYVGLFGLALMVRVAPKDYIAAMYTAIS